MPLKNLDTSIRLLLSINILPKRLLNGKTILEGARSNLQANMPLSLWPYASKHHAMAINVVKQLNGGDSPWSLRFDNVFLGRQLPFGCLLFFWEGKYEPKRGKFAPNAKKGVFLGYNIQAGRVWRGEYLVANVDSLDYFLKEGHLKTIRTKRVALPNGDFIFPLHYKEKPVLDLQDLDYQPEEDDEDDPPDGDDQDDDDPGPEEPTIREDEKMNQLRSRIHHQGRQSLKQKRVK